MLLKSETIRGFIHIFYHLLTTYFVEERFYLKGTIFNGNSSTCELVHGNPFLKRTCDSFLFNVLIFLLLRLLRLRGSNLLLKICRRGSNLLLKICRNTNFYLTLIFGTACRITLLCKIIISIRLRIFTNGH